ncbi:MAG: hypothetical protein QOI95_2892 [Acidimicrobiaceae bacterium]
MVAGKPESDEFELTAFGAGYGESLAIHLGGGEWLTVDCCRDKNTKRLPVLDYFDDIGVDAAIDVRLVMASHWHDDHVSGLDSLLERCTSAQFACSAALDSEEIWALADCDASQFNPMKRRVREFRDVLGRLADGHAGRTTPTWALELLPLYRRDHAPPCTMTALSPSHKAKTVASRAIAELLKSGRVGRAEPNDASIVVLGHVGDASCLLGGDLETTSDPEMGWDAVIAAATREQSLLRANVIKIPHHGSPTAHHDGIWSELCDDRPIGVVAPWQNAGDHRPRTEDVEYLYAHVTELFLCAPAHPPDSQVDDAPRRGRPRKRNYPPMGRVTLRRRPSQDWTVDLSVPAHACSV